MEKRDVKRQDHPASFPIALAKRVIEQFTHPGELVLDPFAGSGTTLIAARDLNRNAVGIDLNPDYVDLAYRRLSQEPELLSTQQIMYCDNALNAHQYVDDVKLVFTSPPYGSMMRKQRKNDSRKDPKKDIYFYNQVLAYSDNPDDLGNMDDDRFMQTFLEVFARLKPKINGHVVIDIIDPWINKQRKTYHIDIIQGMRELGYVYTNMIIWDKRKLFNGVSIYGYPARFITFGSVFNFLLHFEAL